VQTQAYLNSPQVLSFQFISQLPLLFLDAFLLIFCLFLCCPFFLLVLREGERAGGEKRRSDQRRGYSIETPQNTLTYPKCGWVPHFLCEKRQRHNYTFEGSPKQVVADSLPHTNTAREKYAHRQNPTMRKDCTTSYKSFAVVNNEAK
jgi:hypothetical protein